MHRQAVDNKEKKNYIQMYVERMGAQNEEKKFKEKKRATVDQRQKKNKYSTNNGTLFQIYSDRRRLFIRL